MRTFCVHRMFLGLALPVIIAMLGTGCGAMFNSSVSIVPVRVRPIGARIYLDGQYLAQAPAAVALSSGGSHRVDVQADGYESQGTRIESTVSGGYVALDCLLLLALVVPGVLALIIDGASGDWKNLDTARLDFQLNVLPRPLAILSPVTPGPGGCQYDVQCKGHRVCQSGQCVDADE